MLDFKTTLLCIKWF